MNRISPMAAAVALPLMAFGPNKPSYTPLTPTVLPEEVDSQTRGIATGVEIVLDAALQDNPKTVPVFDLKEGGSCHFHVDLPDLGHQVFFQRSELDNIWLVRVSNYQIACNGYTDMCYSGGLAPGSTVEQYPEEHFTQLEGLGNSICYRPEKSKKKGFLESLRRR